MTDRPDLPLLEQTDQTLTFGNRHVETKAGIQDFAQFWGT